LVAAIIRTGPSGKGSRTGRGLGYCAGFDSPGFANPGSRRGQHDFGRMRSSNFGGGRGHRNRFYATGLPFWARPAVNEAGENVTEPSMPEITPEQELDDLARQAEYFQTALENIKKREDEIKAESAKS